MHTVELFFNTVYKRFLGYSRKWDTGQIVSNLTKMISLFYNKISVISNFLANKCFTYYLGVTVFWRRTASLGIACFCPGRREPWRRGPPSPHRGTHHSRRDRGTDHRTCWAGALHLAEGLKKAILPITNLSF